MPGPGSAAQDSWQLEESVRTSLPVSAGFAAAFDDRASWEENVAPSEAGPGWWLFGRRLLLAQRDGRGDGGSRVDEGSAAGFTVQRRFTLGSDTLEVRVRLTGSEPLLLCEEAVRRELRHAAYQSALRLAGRLASGS